MSIPSVSHRFTFGVHMEGEMVQQDMVYFLDDNTVVFPSGSNVVFHDRKENTQRFIPLSEKGEAITSIALSADRKWLAVAERSASERPVVIVYEISSYRKRKTLVLDMEDLKANTVTHMAFSGDGRYLVTQTNGPEWLLSFWTWEKNKLIGSVSSVDNSVSNKTSTTSGSSNVANSADVDVTSNSFALYQLSFNRFDATMAVLVGKNFFKCFRHGHTEVFEFTYAGTENQKILSHAWLKNENLVLGTDDGSILVYDRETLAQTIPAASVDVGAILSITPFKDGFVVAGASKKLAVFHTLMDEATKAGSFGRTYTLDVPEDFQAMRWMTCNPSETTLLCMSYTNQIMGTTVKTPKTVDVGAAAARASAADGEATEEGNNNGENGDGENGEEDGSRSASTDGLNDAVLDAMGLGSRHADRLDSNFTNILQPLHHGRITGMDTCIRKPIIVTVSTDKSVRLWNYLDNKLMAMKYFADEALSVSLHPSGLYLMVGFTDKLRLLSVLSDDLKLFKEFPIRGCRECRFSSGGHMFAAVHGNNIQVFNLWTFETIATLKGHNGKVKSLFWSKDDDILVSSGADGAVYGWSLHSLKRENENIQKGCSYFSAVCSNDGKSLYAVGSDKAIKQISESQIVREIPADVPLTQISIAFNGQMLFVGTQTGCVRALKFPFHENDEFLEHRAHSAPVTRLCISHDDQFLFSCSDDGCVYVFRIMDKEEGGTKRDRTLAFSDEILATKSDLEEKRSTMTELKSQTEELKVSNEYQMRLKDMTFAEKMREINEKYSQEIESLKIQKIVLQTERDKDETRHLQEAHVSKERRTLELHQLETSCNQKLMAEFEKFQDLQHESILLQEKWDTKMKEKLELHQRLLSNLTDDNEAKLRMKDVELQKLQEEMRQQRREFEEIRRQMEEDIDTEIQNLQAKFEKRLRSSHDECLRLKGENGIMKKKFNTLYKEIEDMKAEKQRLGSDQNKLEDVIKANEKEAATLKKEIQERDDYIQDKERRVYELKKSNQELEKFKFVLDHKIRDLKKQIEPKENDIADMNKHIFGLSKELEDYYTRNMELEKSIDEQKVVLSKCKKVYLNEKQKAKNVNKLIATFKTDLENIMNFYQEDPEILQKQFKKLYKKYCKDESRSKLEDMAMLDAGLLEEVVNQNSQLEARAAALKTEAKQNTAAFKTDNTVRIKENESIIKELLSIRKERKMQIKSQDVSAFQNNVVKKAPGAQEKQKQGTSKPETPATPSLPHFGLLPSIVSLSSK